MPKPPRPTAGIISGTVKITTEEVYRITLLAPMLRELHELHPEIMIELDTSRIVRDLGAGEADISLRSTKDRRTQAAGLVGRQLCADEWTLYCSRDYAARHGVPTTQRGAEQPRVHRRRRRQPVDALTQPGCRISASNDQVAMHHATSGGLLSGVRSGFGIAVLPCIVADADPELIRCVPPSDGHGRVLWLFTHERVRHTPRVRIVIDFLYEQLSRHVRELEAKQNAKAA